MWSLGTLMGRASRALRKERAKDISVMAEAAILDFLQRQLYNTENQNEASRLLIVNGQRDREPDAKTASCPS